MFLDHEDLRDVGQIEKDWPTVDEAEAKRHSIRLRELTPFTVGSQATRNNPDELHLGWDEKRQELIRHYGIALQTGAVSRLKTRMEREEHQEQ